MAGKFGAICTEFPLTTFSTKNLNGFLLIFRPKLMLTSPCAKFLVTKTLKQPLVSVDDFFLRVTCLWIFFAQNDIHSTFTISNKASFSFLCTANWRVSNLNFLLKNDKYSLPCCYKKYIFQPYLFLCCYTVWFDANWSVFVKKELCAGAKIILNRFLLFWSQRLRQSENFSSQIFFLH